MSDLSADDLRWKPIPDAVPVPGQELAYVNGEPWLLLFVPQATVEAIRKTLLSLATSTDIMNLPWSVIEWVLEGER